MPQREVRPLRILDMNAMLGADDLASTKDFPPEQFAARNDRLDVLQRVYDGDWRDITDESIDVSVNHIRASIDKLTAILMTSRPEPDEEVEIDDDLAQAIVDAADEALVHRQKFGMSVLMPTRRDGVLSIEAVNPRYWYPGDSYDVIAVPFTPQPNNELIQVTEINANGSATQAVHNYSNGRLGEAVTTPVAMEAIIVRAARRPIEGQFWGTSSIPDLVLPALEYDRRLARHSYALDKNQHPLLMAMVDDSTLEKFNETILRAAVGQAVSGPDRNRMIRDALQDYFSDVRDYDAAVFPAGVSNIEALTWDGNLQSGFMQLDEMRTAIAELTGLPTFLTEEGIPASGVALKRLLFPLYASSARSLNDLRLALQRALRWLLSDPEMMLDWPHAFEVMEDDAASSDDGNDEAEAVSEGDAADGE